MSVSPCTALPTPLSGVHVYFKTSEWSSTLVLPSLTLTVGNHQYNAKGSLLRGVTVDRLVSRKEKYCRHF
ncbi:hypothetical protein E2C01_088351 [Portunus trituberculatus]|uniref:Uncharacterized protein n=1 Tax=Portunus trituberculatus TaxID=210409 RepID=A0A5B7JJM2_PORTR|nr:hypothetical protein [Portunus trituberculatus]